MTFKPQRLAAASDVSRRMQPDLPSGSAKHVARMVPVTATIPNDGVIMPPPAGCTFAPKLVTDYTLPSEVRAAQSSSDWRSARWLLQPCGFKRRRTSLHARAKPWQVHVVQLGGSNVAAHAISHTSYHVMCTSFRSAARTSSSGSHRRPRSSSPTSPRVRNSERRASSTARPSNRSGSPRRATCRAVRSPTRRSAQTNMSPAWCPPRRRCATTARLAAASA